MVDTRQLTPMMSQYRRVKERHKDAIVFFRLGDFYETFFDDAAVVARELEITLTSREAGKGRRVPMAGIPHHAADGYVARLLDRGFRVAICDQVEDPAQAKGLVRREVTRVVTPGTVVDPRALPERAPNYLAVAATTDHGSQTGLAACDFSTGEFIATSFTGETAAQELCDELARLGPREILLDSHLMADERLQARLAGHGLAAPRILEDYEPDAARASQRLAEGLRTITLTAFGIEDRPAVVVAAYALWEYLRANNQAGFTHLSGPRYYSRGEFMRLDAPARRHLEVIANSRDGKRHGSLLWAIDATVTAAGGRTMRSWLAQPLTSLQPILRRQEAVGCLVADGLVRAELRQALKGAADLARLVARASTGVASAREVVAVGATLAAARRIRGTLDAACGGAPLLADLAAAIDPHDELMAKIASAIADSPPAGLQEGGLIRDGFHAEVDRLRALRSGGKGWLAQFEARERERTGIRSLKVGYNRVFGYYIEVTRSNLAAVPDDFTRRQTLANGERFVTAELKEREAEILGAEESLFALEYELFCEVRAAVAAAAATLQSTACAVAETDCIAALAEIAVDRGYCRPDVDDGNELTIVAGRHPVLELTLASGFVPNDVSFGAEAPRLLVITGPNMAGKSTYLRQTALIVLLAQVGSFVPAERARIGIADQVFTRIGASDDLAAGQSTFMVEMQEVAHILRHATARSLVILDEVGRGTSTFDGISLARAVLERLASLRSRTMFATHYHELIALAQTYPHVANFSTAVLDRGGEVIFPHKVRPGGSDRSYGIEVARLAGLPDDVLARARALLANIEAARGEVAAAGTHDAPDVAMGGTGGDPGHALAPRQISFLEPAASPALEKLLSIDIDGLTPREALNTLARLQQQARKERS